MPKLPVRTIVYLGVLTALEIVLSRFLSISAWNLKIGLSFVPVAAAAMLFGPWAAGVVGALGDLLGAVLFPVGPYFPGFTLTAFLTGAVYGLFLYKKRGLGRILGAVALQQIVLSFLLNSFWISVLYESPFTALLASRAVQCVILIPVQVVVLLLMDKALERYGRRLPS